MPTSGNTGNNFFCPSENPPSKSDRLGLIGNTLTLIVSLAARSDRIEENVTIDSWTPVVKVYGR